MSTNNQTSPTNPPDLSNVTSSNGTDVKFTVIPLMQSYGDGEVLRHPNVKILFVGKSFQNQNASFAANWTQDTADYLQGEGNFRQDGGIQKLKEYSVGKGTGAEAYFVDGVDGAGSKKRSAIETGDLVNLLATETAAGRLGSANAETLYGFIIEEGTVLTQNGQLNSNAAFHTSTQDIPIVVVPLSQSNMTYSKDGTTYQTGSVYQTSWASWVHELDETAVSPVPSQSEGLTAIANTDAPIEIHDQCGARAGMIKRGHSEPLLQQAFYSNEKGGCKVPGPGPALYVSFQSSDTANAIQEALNSPISTSSGLTPAKKGAVGLGATMGGLAALSAFAVGITKAYPDSLLTKVIRNNPFSKLLGISPQRNNEVREIEEGRGNGKGAINIKEHPIHLTPSRGLKGEFPNAMHGEALSLTHLSGANISTKKAPARPSIGR